MSQSTINQPATQPTMQQRLLGDRQPTIGDLSRMRGHAQDAGVDVLREAAFENLLWGVACGNSKMSRQAAFDLECIRLIVGSSK